MYTEHTSGAEEAEHILREDMGVHLCPVLIQALFFKDVEEKFLEENGNHLG